MSKGVDDLVCSIHQYKVKYACIERQCPERKRDACAECLVQGPHLNHSHMVKQELIDKIQQGSQQTLSFLSKITRDSNLEDKIRLFFDDIKQRIEDKIENLKCRLIKDLQSNIPQIISTRMKNLESLLKTLKENKFHSELGDNMDIILELISSDPKNLVEELLKDEITTEENLNYNTSRKLAFIQKEVDNFLVNSIEPHIVFGLSIDSSFRIDDFRGVARVLEGHSDFVRQVIQLSTSGRIIASGSDDGHVLIWDTESRQPLLKKIAAHSTSVYCLLQLNQEQIATCSQDRAVKIWNWNSGQCVITLNHQKGPIYCITSLAPAHLASCSGDQSIIVWNYEEAKVTHTLLGHTNQVYAAIKLNEELLASGAFDMTIRVWTWKQAKSVHTFTGHQGPVRSLACLNHQVLASGSDDLTIQVWNYSDFTLLRTLEGHEQSIYALEPINEEEIFSGSYDQTMQMWNWREGQIIASLNSKNQGILTLCRLNSKKIITAGDDYSVLIWE